MDPFRRHYRRRVVKIGQYGLGMVKHGPLLKVIDVSVLTIQCSNTRERRETKGNIRNDRVLYFILYCYAYQLPNILMKGCKHLCANGSLSVILVSKFPRWKASDISAVKDVVRLSSLFETLCLLANVVVLNRLADHVAELLNCLFIAG